MHRCRPMLGTFVEIESDCAAAIEAGFAAVERIHRLMSAHDPASELSRLNQGERVELSPDTRAVLERSLFWFAASGGIFDPAVAGRIAIDRGTLPLHRGHARSNRDHDLSVLRVEGPVAWLERPACIDLGGIAKGHAVDAAVAAMGKAGALSGLVNAGGDLSGFGRPHCIQVVDPSTQAPRLAISLDNRALATSAGLARANGLSF
ncbi:MAG: FAD:protein FMN transferase, partial [Pseudomonadota bacterium]